MFIIILFVLYPMGIWAQEATVVSGGDFFDSSGSVNFTIGQVVYSTQATTNCMLSEGVQQPYEISVFTDLNETEINLSVSAFPNPTNDFLTLKVEKFKQFSDLHYNLFSLKGKLLGSKNITGNETCICMSSFKPSIYFIKIVRNNEVLKTFKIVKY